MYIQIVYTMYTSMTKIITHQNNVKQCETTLNNVSQRDMSSHVMRYYEILSPNISCQSDIKKCKDDIIEHYQTLEAPKASPVSNVFNAWADWIRTYEPFDWFATFTFKTDILTFSQNHPSIQKARYVKVNNEDKFDREYPPLLRAKHLSKRKYDGHYELEYYRKPWPTKDDYERTGEYAKNVQYSHSTKIYNRWIRKLNTEIFGKRYREKNQGLLHIYAIEYQKRGVAHLHSLIKGVPQDTRRKTWEKVWEGMHPNNGFCNIFPYDPKKGGCGYIGKYILKGGQVDISKPRPKDESVYRPT